MICKFLIKRAVCCIIPPSLSDPNASVRVKGVTALDKINKFVKRIVEGVIVRFIYDVLKHLFKDDD